MPSNQISWQFTANDACDLIGPRDSGIEHYTNNLDVSLIRETIQNSLDARQPGTPVQVSYQIEQLSVESFKGSELAEAFNASIKALSPEDDEYRKQFRKAESQLQQKTVLTLVITDSNTTGADDNDTERSPWKALTRGYGESAKPGKNASGSYGIGKAATFAVTLLRTILYSTTFQSGNTLERRFIGRAILSGHKDSSGNNLTGRGYLSPPPPPPPPPPPRVLILCITQTYPPIFNWQPRAPGYGRPVTNQRTTGRKSLPESPSRTSFMPSLKGNWKSPLAT